MQHYTVTIRPQAEYDIINRYEKIAEESPQDALHWYHMIMQATLSLDKLAERCPIAPEDQDIQRGIRHLVAGKYRILYVIEEHEVVILHVRHSRHDRTL